MRGEIVAISAQIQKELDSGSSKYPFKKLVPCNIGNPQAVGQEPLTSLSATARGRRVSAQ